MSENSIFVAPPNWNLAEGVYTAIKSEDLRELLAYKRAFERLQKDKYAAMPSRIRLGENILAEELAKR